METSSTILTPSSACTTLIKLFEGVRAKAYPDPATGAEPWTIGVGHTGPEVRKGLVWTDAQIEAALVADLQRFAIGVRVMIAKAKTTQHQFDALVSFAFNCGLTNLRTSTLMRKHVAGDYAGARAEFSRWNKAAGRVMNGLTKRRAAEAALYGS
jgi:lysozyme